ncbi:MAG: SDR family oxidoreductase, partial [Desulfobacteraceae bacterium]|nr:SDR family oxidoreductase [Desulfobacteraceae bacterium]
MNLLILGGNSDIGFAIAREFARKEGANIILASRDTELLKKKARDIELRYQVKAQAVYFNATDYESHAEFYEKLDQKPDGVIVAFGFLGEQEKAQRDFQEARRIVETNYIGALSILEVIAADFEIKGSGFIIGISSVAGDRGRQSNYIYGSAKGAFAIYLSGLRNRLSRSNVRVITVLPGFVRTKMTRDLKLQEILMSEPEDVAQDIFRAYRKGRDIIYVRWF